MTDNLKALMSIPFSLNFELKLEYALYVSNEKFNKLTFDLSPVIISINVISSCSLFY